jgi:rhamnogalacturonan endolyase
MNITVFGRMAFALLVMPATLFAQKLEKIDRGLVASCIDGTHTHVGWRLFRDDIPQQGFNIYRKEIGFTDFEKINTTPVTTTTDFVDATVKAGKGYRYKIKSIREGKEQDEPGEASVFAISANQPYYSIKLNDPISLKKAGIGDLDGDGAYDFVVQSPAFNADPYHEPGYWKRSPETYKLTAYSSKGKLLWQYDMGWAIEAGTWYAPYLVYDVDGDGRAEVYTKAGEGDPREMNGRVLEGPEFLVKLDPATGKVIKKIPWLSKEGFESYNYWSRNFLDVAYLNGKTPSLIMQRGTYTIIKTEALDKDLKRIWYWESSGDDKKYRGQGQHGILTADIDNDGKDEVIPGTFALDDNGKPLWGLGLGHNDVGYIADIDPSRPGLEIFYGIESRSPRNGTCLVEAATGKIIWGFDKKTFHVHSQGMIGDIDPAYPGIECYAGEAKGGFEYFLWSADGKRLSDKKEVMEGDLAPRSLWWDADELKEIVIGKKLFKYKGDTLQNIEGSILLVADIIGDWREEIVVSLPGELRIYTTNLPAINKRICHMQDRQYRLGVADATSGYYYPAQVGLEPQK